MQTETTTQKAKDWFQEQGWMAFPFQEAAWEAYLAGKSGLVNAPTGSGKTYSLIVPILIECLQNNPEKIKGLQAIWITPIRALTREIKSAAERAVTALDLDWQIAIRSGDTKQSERKKQKTNPPQILVTTPESLQLLLASKGYPKYFKSLKTVVIDEWHELLGSKRGVQMELALSRLKGFLPQLKVWGISATVGNMDEALEVLLGKDVHTNNYEVIRANITKEIEVHSLIPDEIETFPWAGHLGLKMLEKVVPIIHQSKTTLIFTNTRAQSEIWYQNLLEVEPDLAGQIAMHHGSISRELRDWVEDALHNEQLKAVVCTSSLDLGVDFRPVESIVQIGSPKGVARFMQRAGRSGHQPGAKSRIYFVPTHSLELIESAALRESIDNQQVESRIPYIRSFDVLLQFLVTLAVSEGFEADKIYEEIKGTFSFNSISKEEWLWCLNFITTGGATLEAYDEHHKVVIEEGKYKVTSRKIAMRHRMSIGTIVGETSLKVKYVSGGYIGTVEEWFAGQLKPGDNFWFAGRSLELVRIKEMTLQVRKSKAKKGKIPAWLGGRLELSSQLSETLRQKIHEIAVAREKNDLSDLDIELQALKPLNDIQDTRSHIPKTNEFLIEYFKSREGYHLLFYPFEGRNTNEGMASLFAYRLSKMQPISFSIAINDYGFELLSDVEIPIKKAIKEQLFSTQELYSDIQSSINSTEVAKRRFRDIASIAGLVFKGFPGKQKKDRHLQSSSQLFFQVFSDYEPNNLLLLQAQDEVMTFQVQEARLRAALKRIQNQEVILSEPKRATPYAFPILVDRLREKLSSEKLEDRVKKMKLQLVKG
ncbi:MAG: ligase-associated DNA damage response DEXH box helicase [Bacteroidota bacterium]